MKIVRLFVWGTLKKGECNDFFMEAAGGKFIANAKYAGVPSGEIYDVSNIKILDEFEGYYGYERKILNFAEQTPVYYYVRRDDLCDDFVTKHYFIRKRK